MTIAEQIRQFFRDLFGSRLIQRLEYDLLETRNDYERRLAEKNELIDALRAEIMSVRAKMELWEQVIIPVASPVGKLFSPKREQTFEAITGPEPGSWAWVQAEHARKEAELMKPKEPSNNEN